ncbi:MAG: hypothetical protein ACO1N0_05835 [Fluviicola sp.]
MLKSFKLTFLFILFFSSNYYSQRDVFEWGEGLTEYSGKFDTTKFKLEEIETIYNYLCENHGELFTIGSIWKIGQMDTATTKTIDDYYFKTRHTLRTMKIPAGKFWDDLRISRERELFEVCEKNRLFILAIKNPAILYEYYHEECASEIKALNGDSTQLLKAWFDLKEKQKLENCCPDNVEKKYQQQLHSKNHLLYARYEVMTYGWGNCMNQFVYYHPEDEQIQIEFEKLFVQVKVEEYED